MHLVFWLADIGAAWMLSTVATSVSACATLGANWTKPATRAVVFSGPGYFFLATRWGIVIRASSRAASAFPAYQRTV